MEQVRPTLRCLREDLTLPLPPASQPLDELDHPILAKAREQFADPSTRHERIAAIDDKVLFKVKVQRWRGAVWNNERRQWLVAAGHREAGSPDDFYAVLAADARSARARYNAGHKPPLNTSAYVAHLLPTNDDLLRHRLEAGVRFVRRLEKAVPDLVRASLRTGREHTVGVDGLSIGVQVRADGGTETYVAVRIEGSVPRDVTKIVLDIVPGCDPSGWYPETKMPDRWLSPNEEAWSNLMDTSAAAKLLDVD